MSEEQVVASNPASTFDSAGPDGALAESALANGAGSYGEDNVLIFRDTAHIRQRPSMYIGNTASSGLHHLVYELVYNSVDEALAGYCRNNAGLALSTSSRVRAASGSSTRNISVR